MSDEKKELLVDDSNDRLKEEKIETPYMTAFKNFLRNKLAVVSVVVFIMTFLIVYIGASVTQFYSYYEQPVLKNIKPGFGYLNFPNELNHEKVKKIDSGITFSAALTEAGKLYVWGVDYDGVLSIPEEVKRLSDQGQIKDVATGDRHIIVLTKKGDIVGWGNDFFHQTKLSDSKGNTAKQLTCPPGGCPKELLEKDPVTKVSSEGIAHIDAGDQVSALLTKKGSLHVWGATLNNRLDQVPEEIQGKVKKFSLTSTALLALLEDGTVQGYGATGDVVVKYIPKELQDGSVKVVDVAATVKNGFALDDQGKVYAWGPKQHAAGRLPDFDQKVTALSAGREHVLATLADGRVVSWGENNYGETAEMDIKNAHYIAADFFQNYAVDEAGQVHAWGNNGFMLGSDERGRDLAVRVLHGGKVSLSVGAIAVVIQIFLGTMIGMISGFRGGRLDNLLMRFAEVVSAFPFYPLVITLSATLPPDVPPQTKMRMIMLILGFLGWPGIARLVRGQILAEREKDFVLSARALGIKESNIIFRHILPNVLNIIIVQVTLGYASSLLSEAGLSFLGFGVPFPYPSWGNMLSDAQTASVIESYWWRWIFPGLAVFITALSVNMIGDGLRDALDPKSNER